MKQGSFEGSPTGAAVGLFFVARNLSPRFGRWHKMVYTVLHIFIFIGLERSEA
jgi:hypothetical protein